MKIHPPPEQAPTGHGSFIYSPFGLSASGESEFCVVCPCQTLLGNLGDL